MSKSSQQQPHAPGWYFMPPEANTGKPKQKKETKKPTGKPGQQESTPLTLAWYSALIFFGYVLGACL